MADECQHFRMYTAQKVFKGALNYDDEDEDDDDIL